jgi:hypothetical protein
MLPVLLIVVIETSPYSRPLPGSLPSTILSSAHHGMAVFLLRRTIRDAPGSRSAFENF